MTGETFPCKYQDERVAAMFEMGFFNDFDILCVQECFDGLPGSLKQTFVLYAQKAGFLYSTSPVQPSLYN